MLEYILETHCQMCLRLPTERLEWAVANISSDIYVIKYENNSFIFSSVDTWGPEEFDCVHSYPSEALIY